MFGTFPARLQRPLVVSLGYSLRGQFSVFRVDSEVFGGLAALLLSLFQPNVFKTDILFH